MRNGQLSLLADERMLEPQNAISRALHPRLTPCIECNPRVVVAAIDLHDQLRLRRIEIHDVSEQRHLPLETNAQLTPLSSRHSAASLSVGECLITRARCFSVSSWNGEREGCLVRGFEVIINLAQRACQALPCLTVSKSDRIDLA